MSNCREGEKESTAVRSQRFKQHDDGKWYFFSREGVELGPYDSQQEAEEGLKIYLEFLNCATPDLLSQFLSVRAA